MTIGQVCHSGQDDGQDHVITKDGHDKDHMVTSDKDHMINRLGHEQDNMMGKESVQKFEQRGDHVTPEVSSNTMYYEVTSDTSLHGNNNDGENSYDVHKELDEILSKSDLVDGAQLSLPTLLTTTAIMTATNTTTNSSAKTMTTISTSTNTTVAAVNTTSTTATTTMVTTDTSPSLMKSRDPQSGATADNSNSLHPGFSSSPMSDAVNLCMSIPPAINTVTPL